MIYDTSTAVGLLSGLLGDEFNTLSPEITSTIFETLSANGVLDQLNTLQATLSSYAQVPPHPWDQLKYQLLGEDYKNYTPIALSSIEVPKDFDVRKNVDFLLQHNKRSNDAVLDSVSNAKHAGEVDFDYLHKVHFTTQTTDEDGNITHEYSTDKHRKYVEFVEFIQTLDTANIDDHTEAAKKIVHHFANVFRD